MRRRRPKPVHQMTIAQFEPTFTDEEACRTYLIARRLAGGRSLPALRQRQGLRAGVGLSLAVRGLPSERLSLLAHRWHHL